MQHRICLFAPDIGTFGRFQELAAGVASAELSVSVHRCPRTRNRQRVADFVAYYATGAMFTLFGITGTVKDAERGSRALQQILPKQKTGVFLTQDGYGAWMSEMMRDDGYPSLSHIVLALHAGEHACFRGMHTITYNAQRFKMPEGIWTRADCERAGEFIRAALPTQNRLRQRRGADLAVRA